METSRASRGEVDPRPHGRVLDGLLDACPEQILGCFHRFGLRLLEQPAQVFNGSQQIRARRSSPDS